MQYILTILVFLLIFFLLVFTQKRKKNYVKKMIEKNWGKAIIRFRDFNLIQNFVETTIPKISYTLTEQTLVDIDIENLFSFIDRTETTIGQQFLFSKLTTPTLSIDVLKTRESLTTFFLNNISTRTITQVNLYDLEKRGTNIIYTFFDTELKPINSKYKIHLTLLTSLAAVSAISSLFYPPFFLITIFIFFLNMMIHLIFRTNNGGKLKAIRQVYQIQKTINNLMKLNLPIDITQVKDSKEKLKKFSSVYHFLDFGIPLNDLSSVVFYALDIIKSFFLVEVHLLNFSYKEIIKNKAAVESYFDYIGKIEMAISSASLMSDEEITVTTPTILQNENSILFTEISHPLVTNCIKNSLTLDKKSVFITGSNMSGKSTFLRSVLINSILAQSIYLCFAKSYKSPIIKVSSSIKIADDLLSGKSYYFEEVNIIHEMIKKGNDEFPNLFIIDEIFKGTNTIERVALSKAILQNLSLYNNFVIASSHDLELIELLAKNFDLYHFTESIINNQLYFDHKIKVGGLTTKNAIKIVEMEGFPAEIVEQAKLLTSNKNK